MNYQAGQLNQLEARFERLIADVQALEARMARAEQQIRDTQTGGGGGQGSIGGTVFWARMPSSVSAASGSWPTLTPSTFTSDIYADVGGTLTLQATSQTVRWFYKDAGSSGSLVPVEPADSGTNWDAIANSCTAV